MVPFIHYRGVLNVCQVKQANGVDLDQTPQQAASDLVLHYLLRQTRYSGYIIMGLGN